VTQPVQHFHIAGKDYLEYNDKSHIYVVDRKGKTLIKPLEPIQISENNEFSLINPRSHKEAKFVITDVNGKVISIGLDGKTKETDLGRYPANHWFEMYDMDGDGVKDYVFAWGNNLKVISQKGNVIFNIATGSNLSKRPVFYDLPKHTVAIGLVTADDNKIYLYDRAGNLWKGFPLKGNTQFSLDVVKNSENRFNLMVGSENNLLNLYSVQ